MTKDTFSMPRNSVELTFSERLTKNGFRNPIDKNRWISKDTFKGYVGVASTNHPFDKDTGTYVARDPSKSPLLHNFR